MANQLPLGVGLCGTVINGNTGIGNCNFDFGTVRYFILVPKNRVYSPTEILALQATLTGDATTTTYANRIFKYGRCVTFTDQATEDTQETYGDTSKSTVLEGKYRFMMRFKNAYCGHRSILDFEQCQFGYNILLVDAKNLIAGMPAQLTDGTTGWTGLSMSEFHVMKWKMAGDTTTAEYNIVVELADLALNYNASFVQSAFPVANLPAYVNTTLSVLVPLASNIVTITAIAGCAGQNLFTQFGSSLAVAGLWTWTNGATGAALTITSVTLNAAGTGATFTFGATNYPAAGGTIVGKLNTTAANTANIRYFETPQTLILTV